MNERPAAQLESLLETVTRAVIDVMNTNEWALYHTPETGGASWVDRRRFAAALAQALFDAEDSDEPEQSA